VTPIDVEWYASAPYPPPGWDVRVIGDGDEWGDQMVAARRGADEIVWSAIFGAARMLVQPGVVGAARKPPFWYPVDPCITETLRLYALGLRRVGTEEGT